MKESNEKQFFLPTFYFSRNRSGVERADNVLELRGLRVKTSVYCLWAKPYLYKDFGVPPKRCLLQEIWLFIRDVTTKGERRGVYTQETCLYGKGALDILVTA
jgi:hypothetical protein